MRVVDLIRKKKEGSPLSSEEISFLIRGYTANEIPEYQISAFLMACYFKPPSFEETLQLTQEMLNSGSTLDLSNIPGKKVDKHSTGGVGDKTSLIISPVVAAYDIAVPMISGRGLGHTGGTVDKLESIPGFNVHLSLDECRTFLSKSRMAMMAQSKEIAPADRKMYALRDVTSTVECIPLITASIMSKKLAEGTDGVVLDVKTGSGAFMPEFERSKELAQWLVRVGEACGKKMVALITNMDQPLGQKIGNALEVDECIDVLKGEGPNDTRELSLILSAYMIWLGGKAASFQEGLELAKRAIKEGTALKKFREMVRQQGGDESIVEDKTKLPQSQFSVPFKVRKKGIIQSIQTKRIGRAAAVLGCGRDRVEDPVDPAVGFTLHKKVGDSVDKGDTLLTIHYNDEKRRSLAESELKGAFQIGPIEPKKSPLIIEVIGKL